MSEFTQEAREALDRPEIWKRGLFMLLFSLLYGVAEVVVTMVVLVQFVVVLFTGSTNQQLLRLGSSLSRYSYQVFSYLTFNSEEQPFPMSDWPSDQAENSPWFEPETEVGPRTVATPPTDSDRETTEKP